jgi:hypothetical protein
VELRYENGGALTGPGVADLPAPVSATDTWWLRLTKSGNTYTGAISTDGQTWVQTPGSVSVALNNPGLGVFAIGPDQGAPIDVSFDYIRVVGADTTAPVTTATTAPAQPDGLAGWFKQAVQLTLATEAGATTEYRIGDGAFQAYTGPIALGTDGTRVITYRSRDAAGNTEALKTVTVNVDRTKPTSTATLDPAQPGTGGTYPARSR